MIKNKNKRVEITIDKRIFKTLEYYSEYYDWSKSKIIEFLLSTCDYENLDEEMEKFYDNQL